jgi:N6-L-threonylcarbamoyladenine synthase
VNCLGIESSCDETALAVVNGGGVIGSVLASQSDLHAIFGGVVPELASREHCRYIGTLFDELMHRCGLSPEQIDTVAVARGPGLLGSLLVGVAFAKALALALDAKFIGINHLHAHLLTVGIDNHIHFPALALLVSGGHTHFYHMQSPWQCRQLGKTLDDAAGEAFDKIGKILGLAYPAGRMMDALASDGAADPHLFPRPYLDNDNLDFSFSGLKTAAVSHIEQTPALKNTVRPLQSVTDATTVLKNCCASFSLAVVDTLCAKVERALDRYPALHTLILAGGVASNSLLRERVTRLMQQRGGEALMPPPELCTDNAVMIAYAGRLLARAGFSHDLRMETIPRGKTIPDDMVCGRVTGRQGHGFPDSLTVEH